MTISLALGSRLPAYPTSMGRVLLAMLSDSEIDEYLEATDLESLTPHTITDPEEFRSVLLETRAEGYALVDQELEEGLRSIAVPIRNGRDDVIAAMNVSCHAARVSVSRMQEEYLPRLLATAAELNDQARALRLT